MKIAYISHHGRPCYEFNFFSRLSAEKIKFIDTNFDSYPKEHSDNIEYCKVDYKENRYANKLLHSSAAIVTYQDFEPYLEDVDVIIVLEVFSSLSKQFIQYAKENGKKTIAFVYELIPEHPVYKLPYGKRNKKYCLKNVDLMITVSDKSKEHLVKIGADPKLVITVYPGIDLEVFKKEKEIKDYNDQRIIFVGRLDKHKGIDLFLELVQKLRRQGDDRELWVIGDGNYRKEIESLAANDKGVKYFGRIENSKLPHFLSACGIYVLPCRDTFKLGQKIGSEQFGFSLVEAMACELAVVSTECGAIPEVITDNNLICPQNDFDSFFDAVTSLNSTNIKSIGGKNLFIAKERYDISKQAKLFSEIAQRLLEEK